MAIRCSSTPMTRTPISASPPRRLLIWPERPGEWAELIAGSDDFYMTDVSVFADFYVVEGREDGLDQVEIRYYDAPDRVERISFPESSYDAGLGENPNITPACCGWAMNR